MTDISSLIRRDKEFFHSVEAIREQLSAKTPLPIAINGLQGGAVDAFVAESILEAKRLSGTAALLLVRDSSVAARLLESLAAFGVSALEYKYREPVFHNVSASADIDRERLSVLLSVMRAECDAVVSTLESALSYTMPRALLEKNSLSLSLGDEISFEQLEQRLTALGFVRIDMVESAGQFAVRGGILDIWTSVNDNPTRVEFFGDEVDRISVFDIETQRSVSEGESLSLLPALEVIVDKMAAKRILSEIEKLISKASDDLTKEKLSYEKAYLEAGITLPSRDKYFSLIYKEKENLLSYMMHDKRCVVYTLGTNEIRESATKREDSLRSSVDSLLAAGLVTERVPTLRCLYRGLIPFFPKPCELI